LPFDAVGLRLRFVPVTMNNGGVRLKVEPEIKAPAGDTVAVRRIATELTLAQGQSFVVTGLVDAQQLQRLVPVLFPGAVANANARLLVMVTPRQKAPAQIALAR
ncbi:MAG: type II and III secretion system protein, partial [Bryobacter sp.]|nr:type II and III secretion system protein [Bryobacter sp.]